MEILFSHITDELKSGWIETDRYRNGNLYVQLMTPEEPYATLSTNVDGIVVDKDCFIAKTYSENEGLNEQFIKSGLFEDTGEKVSAGFVSCPILRYKG
jgi:hypothetical protein|tara:strand:- start:242 stop:535 length:294 start_codon:yes stop_codon:yes gene_type:complete